MGRRPARKLWSRQMQGKSESWHPVEVKEERAAVVAQGGMSEMDCADVVMIKSERRGARRVRETGEVGRMVVIVWS